MRSGAGTPLPVRLCGRARFAEWLEVVGRPRSGGGVVASIEGLQTCKAVHECPRCARRILGERGALVSATVREMHAAGRGVYMLTLTMRHGAGDDLRRMRRAVAAAWRRCHQGREWARYCVTLGGAPESIRRLEVTYGERHGWHPHLHVLLFTPRPLTDLELAESSAWWRARWAWAVEREMGDARYRPSDEHGVVMQPWAPGSEYLVKMGLEVASVASKRGWVDAEGVRHRGAWELADEWATTGDERSWQLWRIYADAMKGSKLLTWSRGLRGMRDRLEAELAMCQAVCDLASMSLGEVTSDEWVAAREAYLAVPRLLEAAEAGGERAMRAMLATLIREVDMVARWRLELAATGPPAL